MRFLSSFFGSRSAGKASSQKAKSKRGKQLRKRSLFLESLEGRQMMAVDIVFNYDLDSPTGMFSASTASGQQARQILEIAANTIEARLNEQLAAIEPSGANSWIASFQNPLSSQVQSVNNLSIGQNQIMIIVLSGTDVANQDVVNGSTGTALAQPGSSTSFANLVATRGKTDGSIGIWGGGLAFDSDANWNFSLDTAAIDGNEYDLLTNAFRGIFQTLGFNAQNDNFNRWVDPSTFAFYGALTLQALNAMSGINPPTVAPSINNPFGSTTPTEWDGFWSSDVRFKFSSALGNDLTLMSAPFTLARDPNNPSQFAIDPVTGDFVYETDANGDPLNAFLGIRVLPTSIDYAGLGDLGWNLATWPNGVGDTVDTAFQLNAPNTLRPSRLNGINGAGDLYGFNFSTGLFKFERAIDVEFFRVDVDLSKSGGQPQILTMSLKSSLATPGLTASFRVFKLIDPLTGEVEPIVGLNGEETVVGTSFSFQFNDNLGSGTYFIGISRPQNIYYDATDFDAVDNANPAPFSRALAVGPATGLYSLTGFFGAAHNYVPLAENIIGNVVATTPPNNRILTFGLTAAGQVLATRQPSVNDTGFFWTNLTIPGLVAKSFDAEVSTTNRLAIGSINTQNKLEIRVWANSSSLTFRQAVALPASNVTTGVRNINVTTLADGRFQVYFVGPNNTLYTVTETAINGSWGNITAVAQSVRTYDVFRNTNGIVDVFYLNTTNGSLFTRRSSNTSASAWGVNVALGGTGSQVLAVGSGSGQMNLMLLDAAGNLTVRTRPSYGASYTGAVQINITPIAQISAGMNANGFLTIFATGKDGNVYAVRQQSANWSSVTIDNLQGASQTGGIKSTAVTRNEDGRLQFFAVTATRSLTTRFQGLPNSRFYS
jgi:hypothetical protein